MMLIEKMDANNRRGSHAWSVNDYFGRDVWGLSPIMLSRK
jgi:hypothetical protein